MTAAADTELNVDIGNKINKHTFFLTCTSVFLSQSARLKKVCYGWPSCKKESAAASAQHEKYLSTSSPHQVCIMTWGKAFDKRRVLTPD